MTLGWGLGVVGIGLVEGFFFLFLNEKLFFIYYILIILLSPRDFIC